MVAATIVAEVRRWSELVQNWLFFDISMEKTVKLFLIFHLHSSWLWRQLCGQRHVAAVAFEVAKTAPPANRPPNTSSLVGDFDIIMLFLGGRSLLQVVCRLISVAWLEWITSFHQWSKWEKLELLNWNQDSDLKDLFYSMVEYRSSLCLSFFFFHPFTLK